MLEGTQTLVNSSMSRICRLGLLEMLIEVGLYACIHRDECAYVFVSVCVCTMFLEKQGTQTLSKKKYSTNTIDEYIELIRKLSNLDD